MGHAFSQAWLASLGGDEATCIPIPSNLLRYFILGKSLNRLQIVFVSRCDVGGALGGATVPRVL